MDVSLGPDPQTLEDREQIPTQIGETVLYPKHHAALRMAHD
jgi:hypothetical protein